MTTTYLALCLSVLVFGIIAMMAAVADVPWNLRELRVAIDRRWSLQVDRFEWLAEGASLFGTTRESWARKTNGTKPDLFSDLSWAKFQFDCRVNRLSMALTMRLDRYVARIEARREAADLASMANLTLDQIIDGHIHPSRAIGAPGARRWL